MTTMAQAEPPLKRLSNVWTSRLSHGGTDVLQALGGARGALSRLGGDQLRRKAQRRRNLVRSSIRGRTMTAF
jgi:hypothetical protein